MPEGFEVFNEDGTVRNSNTDYFGKVLGQMDVSTPIATAQSMAWPYPDVPANQRGVYCISNRGYRDNQISLCWATFTDSTRQTIEYSQDMDRMPITLMFMQY